MAFQVKLLRALQERKIERLGSNRPIDVDVRIVSASQRPLEEEIRSGRFREDLFFRIHTVVIHLPPLRDRREDIPLLVQSFLGEFADARQRQIEGVTDEVMELFERHPWPGNVRELRNVIERAVLFCKGERITVDDLPGSLRGEGGDWPLRPSAPVRSLHQAVEEAEVEAIKTALATTQGRRAEAAELLGISRKTLWEKIRLYEIAPE